MKYFLLVLITFNSFSQEVSRNTISVVGNSNLTSTGYYVSQSVGQLSTIGFSDINSKSIVAGYQQPTGYKLIDASIEKETLQLYPIPVSTELNMLFSLTMEGTCYFELFDGLGRLVLSKELLVVDYTASISLEHLATSTYIVKITNNKSVFYENIIKND
jgi:hypothetical protein